MTWKKLLPRRATSSMAAASSPMPIGTTRKIAVQMMLLVSAVQNTPSLDSATKLSKPDEGRRGDAVPAAEGQRHRQQSRDEDDDDIDEQCRDQIEPVHRVLRSAGRREARPAVALGAVR